MNRKSPFNGEGKGRKPVRIIAEIKRVWKPGMTARDIAAVVDPKIVKQTPDTITGYFRRWAEDLAPCTLFHIVRVKKPKAAPKEDKPLYGETYTNKAGITLPKVFRD